MQASRNRQCSFPLLKFRIPPKSFSADPLYSPYLSFLLASCFQSVHMPRVPISLLPAFPHRPLSDPRSACRIRFLSTPVRSVEKSFQIMWLERHFQSLLPSCLHKSDIAVVSLLLRLRHSFLLPEFPRCLHRFFSVVLRQTVTPNKSPVFQALHPGFPASVFRKTIRRLSVRSTPSQNPEWRC